MATITDAKDDEKIKALAILTITMNDGTIVTRTIPKSMICTEKKAQSYLASLESIKALVKQDPPTVADMAFLKGTKS